MVAVSDNLDIQVRRKRLGLNQRDVAQFLGVAISAVSDFENGQRKALPHGKSRKDYEQFLDAHERGVRKALAK